MSQGREGVGIYGGNVAIDAYMQCLWKETLWPPPLPFTAHANTILLCSCIKGSPAPQRPLGTKVLPGTPGMKAESQSGRISWHKHPVRKPSQETPAVIRMALKVFCLLCYRARGEPSLDHALLYCTKKSKRKPNQPHALGQRPSFPVNVHLGT